MTNVDKRNAEREARQQEVRDALHSILAKQDITVKDIADAHNMNWSNLTYFLDGAQTLNELKLEDLKAWAAEHAQTEDAGHITLETVTDDADATVEETEADTRTAREKRQDEVRQELQDVVDTYGIQLKYIAEKQRVHYKTLLQFKSGRINFNDLLLEDLATWLHNYRKAMNIFEMMNREDNHPGYTEKETD